MSKLKPKTFLSVDFNFISLKSLFFISSFTKSFSFSSYSLLIFFVLGLYSTFGEATFQYQYKPFYSTREILLYRVPRSPFLPPTVTSFKPSIRKSRTEINKYQERISESKVDVAPPFVASQSSSSSSSRRKNPEQNASKVPQSELKSPVRVTFPRPPMVVQLSKKKKAETNYSRAEFSVTPQNDEHSLTAQEKQQKEQQKDKIDTIIPRSGYIRNEYKKEEAKSQDPDEENRAEGFAGLNEVLEILSINIQDLHQVLKRVGIPMENFLDFIDKEKTKDEIMAYLNLPESLKFDYRPKNGYGPNMYKTTKSIPYSTSSSYEHKYNRVDRQKALVDHLPITEIVHEVPLNSQVTFKGDVSHKLQNKKQPASKNSKKTVASEDKKYKSKHFKNNKHDNNNNNNPFMMNSNVSTMYPPKDSPIIIPYLPPMRKTTKPAQHVTGSAAIVSMTIEKKVAPGNPHIVHETILPVRNKVFTKDERDSGSSKTEKPWSQSSYDQQQANLRLVFPMRGILLLCGGFGIISIITIVMLIIYGTIKCNQKPTSSTYELSEHQEGSTSSVLTNA